MSDLVERLRGWRGQVFDYNADEYPVIPLALEAAARISELEQQLAARDGEIADWLAGAAQEAKNAWAEEERKPNKGEVFWRRYWAGYHTGVDNAATAIASGAYRSNADE